MAVFTKINNQDILNIENQFNLGKIEKFKGIKKGIENTNYLITIKNKKYILTIFEKRVNFRDLPFFMNLMSGLSKLKVKCPNPLKGIWITFAPKLSAISEVPSELLESAKIISSAHKTLFIQSRILSTSL